MTRLALKNFRVQNYKAVRDSTKVEFGPLTAFIGNNGSGKSSIIEALEAFCTGVLNGLDAAVAPSRGLEHVWNQAPIRHLRAKTGTRLGYSHPLTFHAEIGTGKWAVRARQIITLGEGFNDLFFAEETAWLGVRGNSGRLVRGADGKTEFQSGRSGEPARWGKRLDDGESCLKPYIDDFLEQWQFLELVPSAMGVPARQQRAGRTVRLAKGGANVAEYLNEIREIDVGAFNGVVDAVRCVLPYASDLQPKLTSELERAFYLNLKESYFEVPGWLLSSGTLRITALLACLRHPSPPPLLVVEEIENGLDPRTIHMLVEEMRAAIEAGKTQIILTTHSPFLLDLLDLSQIVVVERIDGQPMFTRPDAKKLKQWAKSFAPGSLYTMGRLTKGD